MKRIALKTSLALGGAFGLMLMVLGGLTVTAHSAELSHKVETALPQEGAARGQSALAPQDQAAHETKLPAGLPPAQQGAITPTSLPDRGHWQLLSPPEPPPLPAWVLRLKEGGLRPAAGEISIAKAVLGVSIPTGGGVQTDIKITYTVKITNNLNSPIELTALDVLPTDPQGNLQLKDIDILQCGSTPANQCALDITTETLVYTSSGGGPPDQILIVQTKAITWKIEPLQGNQTQTLIFAASVFCQPDGATLDNQAFFFSPTNPEISGFTNRVTTLSIPLNKSGQAAISPIPSGCTLNRPGGNRLSAGDFDRDGDVDLAVGALTGLSVFRNNGRGQFGEVKPPPNNVETRDVLWADFDNDGDLELLGVGRWEFVSDEPTPVPGDDYFYTGFNSLYDYDNGSFSLITETFSDYTFKSNDGLTRIAAGDYDNDGYLDLATANFWGGCTVLIYRNTGLSPFFEQSLTFGSNLNCLLEGFPNGNTTAYSVAWGDYDNDGDQDLAVGLLDNTGFKIRVFGNNVGTITGGAPVDVELGINSPAIDLAWGDFDQNGFLDLAAVFSNGDVHIYQNNGGAFTPLATNPIFDGPFEGAIDWGDFNGDGQLDLVIAPSQARPQIRRWNGSAFVPEPALRGQPVQGSVFGVRGFDSDNDGDLDLAVADQDGFSPLYTLFVPRLQVGITSLGSEFSQSPAWGDFDNDGDQDLLVGSGIGTLGLRLYRNTQGQLALHQTINTAGFGPHSVAWGDFDGDGDLDIGVSSNSQYQIYRNEAGVFGSPISIAPPSGVIPRSLAWLDTDDDGDLDLVTGNKGGIFLFKTEGGTVNPTPIPISTNPADDIRSIAWLDFNGDLFPDFAAGNYGGQTRLYRNNQNNVFTLDSSLPTAYKTRAIAWADWDGDGQLELALANENQPAYIYKRQGSAWTPVWSSTETLPATSLAWGDWDNDSDFDLAIGNSGLANRVYVNLLVERGSADLIWRWTSDQPVRPTSGVAWGDIDNDGDLELAVTQSGGGTNGIYLNSYVSPSHLGGNFASTMPLPNNPSYLSIQKPGLTGASYFFYSPEILASPTISTISITFRLFDPDGTRDNSLVNERGDDIISPTQFSDFEYSTNGGGTWQAATGVLTPSNAQGTSQQGQSYTFRWNVQTNQIVSDDVRFRITLANHLGGTDTDGPNKRAGLNQRGSVSAVSPPFRVRALNCFWPDNPSIIIQPTGPYSANQQLDFTGMVTPTSGAVEFVWDFGDKTTGKGQELDHSYVNGTYTVALTVTGEACPITRSVVTTRSVVIGTGVPDKLTYLPVIQKAGATATSAEAAGQVKFEPRTIPGAPGQVLGLTGTFQPGSPTQLTWQPNPATDQVAGYRVYRSLEGSAIFKRLADLPAKVTAYSDSEVACDAAYFVTAYNQAGESLPSTSSYFTWPCQ